jgi:hypothetical protein
MQEVRIGFVDDGVLERGMVVLDVVVQLDQIVPDGVLVEVDTRWDVVAERREIVLVEDGDCVLGPEHDVGVWVPVQLAKGDVSAR